MHIKILYIYIKHYTYKPYTMPHEIKFSNKTNQKLFEKPKRHVFEKPP